MKVHIHMYLHTHAFKECNISILWNFFSVYGTTIKKNLLENCKHKKMHVRYILFNNWIAWSITEEIPEFDVKNSCPHRLVSDSCYWAFCSSGDFLQKRLEVFMFGVILLKKIYNKEKSQNTKTKRNQLSPLPAVANSVVLKYSSLLFGFVCVYNNISFLSKHFKKD